ncbi:hypothetical protein BDN67DRAFT_1015887 [Paxillus ammoniavirescens]|nr:hypothetical protein BDN67DRAFT_1015887 [Paxillus ammoniavirescens]
MQLTTHLYCFEGVPPFLPSRPLTPSLNAQTNFLRGQAPNLVAQLLPHFTPVFNSLLPGQEHIQEFHTKVIAYCDPYVITSPNADWIPEPHCFQTGELHVHADGCFGYQDCFQWPQAYSQKFKYTVCIPNPQKMREQEEPLKTLWELWTPTEDDFEFIDPQSPFHVGELKRNISQEVVNQWKAKREGKKDIVTGMVLHSRHLLNVLKHHPLTFPNIIVYVAELQCFLFDTVTHMLYVNDHQFALTYPGFPCRTNHDLMGCFTEDITTCEHLFHAGIPVWLVRSPQFIPRDMNIINVVTVTCPDHIMQKNFVHNGVVTMFSTLHLGRGGTDRHFNSRRTFQAKVLDMSDATSSVVIPQQSTVASSSQTASGGRVQVNRNNNAQNNAKESVYSASGASFPFLEEEQCVLIHNSTSHSITQQGPQSEEQLRQVDKDPARVRMGLVNTSYCFPEPALIVVPVLPEQRKLYCANWLATRPLWISCIDHHPPSPLPIPQTWRDFLNTIPSALLADNMTTKSAREKLAAKTLFGQALVYLQGNTWATQGDISWRNQCITIATLEDPPAHLMRCILWEIYELGFRYELLDLDRAMVPGLWTEAPTKRTELLYSNFPGESGLVMWQEDMPTTEQGMWAAPATVYPFLES